MTRRHLSPVAGLVAANTAVFLAGHWLRIHAVLLDRYAVSLSALVAGRPHTVLTAAFLHTDLGHLLFNMLFLVLFGRACQEQFGAWRTAAVYGGGVVCGNLLFAALFPARSAVGASGGVFALLTAAVLVAPGRPVYDPGGAQGVAIPIAFLGFAYLAPALVNALSVASGTAHIAHVGGAAAGAVLAHRWQPSAVRETVHGLLP